MNEHYTTLEQSKKLLELGLSPETADMYWREGEYINEDTGEPLKEYGLIAGKHAGDKPFIPCWSLGTLMEIIPGFICLNKDGTYWCDWSSISSNTINYTSSEYNTPIEATFETLCYLIENNIIKK